MGLWWMKILISNDDGIYAPGIVALREGLEQLDLVKAIYVVAPDRERSATGHSITMHRPLRTRQVSYKNKKSHGWSVDGTPADCVKLALEEILPESPDMVVAGINQGANLGTDVLYSGTVSAAVEGVINGFPAMAISLTSYSEHDFSHAVEFAAKFIPMVVRQGINLGTLINVNVPGGKPQGVKVTCLGSRRYINIFDRRTDPRGKEYFWMAGEPDELEDHAPDTDVFSNRMGYITISPVTIDLTDHKQIKKICSWKFDKL